MKKQKKKRETVSQQQAQTAVEPEKAAKHPGGRPTKFSPELAEKIISAIRVGGYVETAAAFAGISKDTFYEWLKRGAREQDGEFKEFSDAIGRAIADSEMRYVGVVAKAASGYDVVRERTIMEPGPDGKLQAASVTTDRTHEFNPAAAMWWLERRFMHRWGRMERPEVAELPDDKPIVTLTRETIDVYDPDRLARVIGAFAEAGLIPAEILAGFLIEDASQAAHH